MTTTIPRPTTEAQVTRVRQCPLCQAAPGVPCQRKPPGDHLARYLDAYTAGKLTRAYMAAVVGELVVITHGVIIEGTTPKPALLGQLVERLDDDSPCPLVGEITGVEDDESVYVAWDNDRLHPDGSASAVLEAMDELRPARDGAR